MHHTDVTSQPKLQQFDLLARAQFVFNAVRMTLAIAAETEDYNQVSNLRQSPHCHGLDDE